MFCSSCGNQIADNSKFCTKCGKQTLNVNSNNQQSNIHPYSQKYNQMLIGFSPKINDPAFEKYKRNSALWSYSFAIILALIAIIGFTIYGNSSGEIEWPTSLFYGFGIGGMFIVIAILQNVRRSLDKTWDGILIDKNTYKQREYDDDSNHYSTHTYYNLVVEKQNGGKVKHRFKDLPGIFNYYNIGDRLRHHRGFQYYEKYDKSQDSQIICTACLTMNPIQNDHCTRCKCPLLK